MISAGTLLLVENDESDVTLFLKAAKELGFDNRVKVCNSGEEAIKWLKELRGQIFLILCDMYMPRMTGMQLKEELENTSKMANKTIPFVFFSVYSDEDLLEEAYELGAHGYFLKGDNYNEFINTLKIIIKYWDLSHHPQGHRNDGQ